MCLVIVMPPGEIPDVNTFLDTIDENPDGSGYVVRTDKGFIYGKDPKDDTKILKDFLAVRAAYPNTWAVWHSRIATQGQLVYENTHPIKVPNRPWFMAHNGILPLSDSPVRKKVDLIERSDSRILAEDHFANTHWREILRDKEEWDYYLSPSKVVLLSSAKEKGGPIIIFNEGEGFWDKIDGCWYSHRKYSTGWSKSVTPSTFDSETGRDLIYDPVKKAYVHIDDVEDDEDFYMEEYDRRNGRWVRHSDGSWNKEEPEPYPDPTFSCRACTIDFDDRQDWVDHMGALHSRDVRAVYRPEQLALSPAT